MQEKIISTLKSLFTSDGAFVLSFVVLFNAFTLLCENTKKSKFIEVYFVVFCCMLYIVMYQVGSIRWAYYSFNSNILTFDFYFWTVTDIFLQLMLIGIMIAFKRIISIIDEVDNVE